MGRLRVAIGVLILALMIVFCARFVPPYLDNMRLQSYVEEIAQDAESQTRPDDALRVAVLEKAAFLGLPVKADNVHIKRSGDKMRIDLRYNSRVDFLLYTVDLHFYPGASNR
jgi:hypothetical protein